RAPHRTSRGTAGRGGRRPLPAPGGRPVRGPRALLPAAGRGRLTPAGSTSRVTTVSGGCGRRGRARPDGAVVVSRCRSPSRASPLRRRGVSASGRWSDPCGPGQRGRETTPYLRVDRSASWFPWNPRRAPHTVGPVRNETREPMPRRLTAILVVALTVVPLL